MLTSKWVCDIWQAYGRQEGDKRQIRGRHKADKRQIRGG